MKTVKAALVVVGLLFASTAFGADDSSRKVYTASNDAGNDSKNNNVYLGFGLGQGTTNLTATLRSNNDTAYNLFAGYKFSRNLSAEVAYFNLGSVKTVATISGKSSGVSVAAVGALSLGNDLSFFGKFGVAKVDTKWDSAPATGLDATQFKTALTWGAGISLDISPKAEMRLSYDSYSVGSADPIAGHTNLVSLAAILKL
jgi:opacity protein-like surface antigen